MNGNTTVSEASSCTVSTAAASVSASTVSTNVPQRIMPVLYLQQNVKNNSTSNNVTVSACPTTNTGTSTAGTVQFAVPQTKSTVNKQKRETPKNLPMKIQLAGGNNTQILHSAQGQNAAQAFAYLGTLIKQSTKGKETTSQKVLLTPMTVQNKSSQMTSLILPSTGGTSTTPKGNVTSLILQSTGTVPPSNKATMTGLLIPNSTTTTSSGKTQVASLIFNNQQTQQNQNTAKKLPVTNIILPNSSPAANKTANVPNIIRQSATTPKNQLTGIFLPPTSNSSTGQITSLLIPSNSNMKSNNNQVGLIIPTSSASSTNQMGLLVPATTTATSQLANIILAPSNSTAVTNTEQISAGLIFPNNGNSVGAGPSQMASLLIPTSAPNGNGTSVSVSGMIIPTTTSTSSHSQMTGLILPVAMAKQNQSGFVAITPGKSNIDSQQTGGKTTTTLSLPPLQPIIKDGVGKSLLLPKPNGIAVPELIVTPVTENEIEKKECYRGKENSVDVEMTVERTETVKPCHLDEIEVKEDPVPTKADVKSEETMINNEDEGVLLDGEVTVRRLAVDSEETSFPEKQPCDDDVKIEIVKPENDRSLSPTISQKPEDLDPMQVIEWDQQGVGKLPGSKIKFRMNEFGMMEVVVDKTSENQEDTASSNTGTPNSSRRNSEDKNQTEKQRASDEIFCCEGCGCYGLYSEFLDTKFCSIACKKIILTRIAIKKKRQEDRLRDIRVRRKKRKMNILAQRAKKEAVLRVRHHKLLTSHSSSNGSAPQLQKKCLSEEELPIKAWVNKMAELCGKSTKKPNDMDSGKESTFINEKRESDDEIKSADSPVLSEEMDASMPSETISRSPTVTDDEGDNAQTAAKSGRWSWLNSAGEFMWNSYLQYCNKAKAAPVKLFKSAFPYAKNGFKVGMKLEAIDPEHQSYFSVMTVAEIKGYRLRLHFDGYPDTYDFWTNADSPDIFQPGWCEKNNHRLHPPRGYTPEMFNWIGYLKQCKAQAAAKHHFGKTTGALCPNQFRVGMKLEAVDRKNSSLVCVASVADLIDNRLLIHFDGWGDIYDYWTDPTSPYIHPVGWCEENGHELIPPNNYKNSNNFSWDVYLKETKSVAAPARAFKTRPPTGFKRGMKLEVVDKRSPSLLRVATVSEVHQHQIKIQLDGFPEHFGYWVDDDNPDIHPIYWGQKTGHPVEPPPNGDEKSECQTPGCQGDGNLKGGKYTTHSTVAFCPYSAQNLNKETRPNRFCAKPDVYHVPEPVKFKSNREPVELTNEENIIPNSVENKVNKSKLPTAEKEIFLPKEEVVEEKIERRGRKRKIVEPETTSAEMNRLRREVIESVFQPGYRPTPKQLDGWVKHSAVLGSKVNMTGGDPRRWNYKQVASFVNSVVPGLSKPFIDQEIDGEAFLMMSQTDLTIHLGIKLGPAIRIFNCIVLLRDKVW